MVGQVHLDTGSSDLWFNMENVTVAGLKPTNIPASVEHECVFFSLRRDFSSCSRPFRDGSSSSGSVIIGNVTWGGYAVHNQAFST